MHQAQRGRVSVKSRPSLFKPTGMEILMFALLGAALFDALLITWLFWRGIAG